MSVVRLIVATRSSSAKIIKEVSGSVANGAPYIRGNFIPELLAVERTTSSLQSDHWRRPFSSAQSHVKRLFHVLSSVAQSV